MIDWENIESVPAAMFLDELIKTAMAVNEISGNEHVPEKVKKTKKAELKVLKQEALRRLEKET